MKFHDSVISFIRNKDYRNLFIAAMIVVAIGSIVYHYVEGWRWLDAIYFSMITLTTVGFGDFSPQTDAGKIFTIFYLLAGIGIMLSFFSSFYTHYNDTKEQEKGNPKGKNPLD